MVVSFAFIPAERIKDLQRKFKQQHPPESRRTTALAAALSLLPLGQPLLLGTLGITTATTAVLLQAPPAIAQDASAVARVAKAITVRIEGATQGSGVLVKKK